MKNLNNYIIEKLYINKDSNKYKPNYIDGIFKILDKSQ